MVLVDRETKACRGTANVDKLYLTLSNDILKLKGRHDSHHIGTFDFGRLHLD